jgi:hypothetical protein
LFAKLWAETVAVAMGRVHRADSATGRNTSVVVVRFGAGKAAAPLPFSRLPGEVCRLFASGRY